MPEATTKAETYHRHGGPDPSKWDEQPTVTDRPNDTPMRGEETYAVPNSTFGSRAKSSGTSAKAVESDEAENKAVGRRRAKRK